MLKRIEMDEHVSLREQLAVAAFRAAFTDPGFKAAFARYPDSTVASHLFHEVAVPGVSEG